jgi:hypothetical protein
MSNELLIIFAKNPVLGLSKTRIADETDDRTALRVYQLLLEHLNNNLQKLTYDVHIYFSDFIPGPHENPFSGQFSFHVQSGPDLGFRMHEAITRSYKKGYKKIILAGSDIPDLTPEITDQGFSELNSGDVVLGPATDGGYYMIGMNHPHQAIFKSISWSTAQVMNQTLNRLKKHQLSYYILPELEDIDTWDDVCSHHFFKGISL